MTQSTVAPSRTHEAIEVALPQEERSHSPMPASPDTETYWVKDGFLYNVVIPLLLLFAAIGVFWAWGKVQSPVRPPDDTSRVGRLRALTPVRVQRLQTLESTGQPLYLVVDGTVVPYREAKVAAEVAGRIIFKSDNCEAGSYVQRDELLMRIDPTDYELEIQRLTRLREQEYQALQELDQEMANTTRLIKLARDDVALQQAEVERLTSLPKGFSSLAEVDQANRTLLAATQGLYSFENQLELQKKRRVRLEASEQLVATQLQAAEVNLKRTEIRAPIEGVIVSEDADLNTFVSRGSALMTIEDTSKVEVTSSLRMDQLYWVLNQQDRELDNTARGYDLPETAAIIEYELAGRDGAVYRWRGRLMSYDGIGLDPNTRTVPVRVVVDNPRAFVDDSGNAKTAQGATPLVRGMFVRVKLIIHPQTPLVVIPSGALQPGNRIFQFIPDDSVLDTPSDGALHDALQDTAFADEAASGATTPEDAMPQQAVEATADQVDEPQPRFVPEQWQPGRVVVRKSVYPVDSLLVDKPGQSTASEASNRFWVCEVRDATLSDESFVVVSPLGTLEEDSFPVRADRQAMGGDSGQETTSQQATAEGSPAEPHSKAASGDEPGEEA